MQTGMEGVSWNFEAFTGPGSLWILAVIGIVMTILMQSSTAAAATTLVALHAGSLTFIQGCALIVGQSVGSAATTALVVIGGSLSVRRTALAHIIFSVIVGVLGMVLLTPLAAAADWVGSQMHDPDGVLALAAFSSIFKLAGVLAFYPWIDQFARFIVKISGKGNVSAVSRLDSSLAEAGGGIALEAAWRAIQEVAQGAVDAVSRRLAGESVKYDPPVEAISQIERFLESLSLETTDLGTIGPRLVRLVHALDHLAELFDDLKRIPPTVDGEKPPAGFAAGRSRLPLGLRLRKTPRRRPTMPSSPPLKMHRSNSALNAKLLASNYWKVSPCNARLQPTARGSLEALVLGRSIAVSRLAIGRIIANRQRQFANEATADPNSKA